MLTIVSTSPTHQAENVYLDKTLRVKFSHELRNSSLTKDNFKIYYYPSWNGQIAIRSIEKEEDDENKILIVPEVQFPENTTLVLWIRGDNNLDDGNVTGVRSFEAQGYMDGHTEIIFTTGTKVRADDIETDEIDAPAEQARPGTGQPSIDAIFGDDYLDVIATYPPDLSSNVSGLTELVFKFDEAVANVDTTSGVIAPISGLMEVTSTSYIYGNEVTEPVINSEDININNDIVTISVSDDDFSKNTEYVFTIHREKITSITDKQLQYDYSLKFGTKLEPMYTDINTVRRLGGYLVPEDLEAYTINAHILLASIWYHEQMGNAKLLTPPYAWNVIQAVSWRVICTIARGIVLGDLGFIERKRLADLQIDYDSDGAKELMDEACQNALDYLHKVKGYNTKTGVKSKQTDRYPGRKRFITKYSRRALLNRISRIR